MIEMLEAVSDLRKEAIVSAINELNLPKGSRGLDAACGIGNVSQLLAKAVGENGHVTGLDIDSNTLAYAQEQINKNNLQDSITLLQGDINNLPFDDNSFDWMVSIDTLWPGPKEFGLPCEDPVPVIEEYKRVVKPGGTIAVLFWSSQKLFGGYPILESKLNSYSAANFPFTDETPVDVHILRAKNWMRKNALEDIKIKSFVADFASPFNEENTKGLAMTLDMLFEPKIKEEIEAKYWDKYQDLKDPKSKNFLFAQEDYCGFITYTMFYAKVPK